MKPYFPHWKATRNSDFEWFIFEKKALVAQIVMPEYVGLIQATPQLRALLHEANTVLWRLREREIIGDAPVIQKAGKLLAAIQGGIL